MELTPIIVETAPEPSGNYSQGIQAGNFIFLSGQIPLCTKNGELINGDIEQQTIQIFENLKVILREYNWDFDRIVKITIYLTDIKYLIIVNKIMSIYFQRPYPARTSIQVSALPKNALIEIDAILLI